MKRHGIDSISMPFLFEYSNYDLMKKFFIFAVIIYKGNDIWKQQ